MTVVRRGAAAGGAPVLAAWQGLAARAAAAGLVALAAWTVATKLYHVARTHNAVPQADEWFSLRLYERILEGGDALRILFEPHNEHRLFFPRLVFFSDYRFFGGSGLLDEAAIFAIQALEAALLAGLAFRAGAGAPARLALGAVAVALLASLYQDENFFWAFQVQFVGVFACASLSATLFASGLATGSRGRTAGGLALVFVATFTMANGLLIGPVLVVLALLSRAGVPAVLAAAAVAALSVAAFLAGYHPDTDRESAAELAAHGPRVLAFTAGYLGNFMRFGSASQVAFGACGLAATAGIAGRMALRGERDPARLALLGIALFAVASALVTAVGRSAFGLEGFTSSRYSTGAAVFWAATLLNGWSLSRGSPAGDAGRALVCVAAALLLEASTVGQEARGLEMERRAVQYGAMEDALLLGLVDAPALRSFEEPVDMVRALEPVLRRRHLSVFAGRDAGLLGRPLSDAEAPGAGPIACAGGFAAARAEPALGRDDGVAVEGTSGLRSRLRRPGRVLIVDAARRVVGFAHTGFGDGRWTGYALARPGDALGAVAMSDAGRPCELGTAVVSPPPAGG